jgi:hypothetical protein
MKRQEAIEKACSIDGWLTPAEAGALYDAGRAATGPIVEIGSWQGRSTAALALGSLAGGRYPVYAVDSFQGVQDQARPTDQGTRVGPGPTSSPEVLRRNLDAVGVNGLVTILPKSSREALGEILECNVLFLDGDHTYESVRDDLRGYLPRLQPGGRVVVHDVTLGDPGVVKAVDELLTPDLEHWRLMCRVDSAVVAMKAPTVKAKIYLGCPGSGWEWGTVIGMVQASRINAVELDNNRNGWDDFNALWIRALNAFEAGRCTHFAMLHSDVVPVAWWLDILLGELHDRQADLVSVAIPIKDRRGLTSTGIGDPNNRWGAFRRYTMRELMDLPETFDLAGTGYDRDGHYLLHNTGCWICDLSSPVFRQLDQCGLLRCYFDFPTVVLKNESGQWVNYRESEDWFFSRGLASCGARTFVTRKVAVSHIGAAGYVNNEPWGTFAEDEDSAPGWRKPAEAPAEAEAPGPGGPAPTSAH